MSAKQLLAVQDNIMSFIYGRPLIFFPPIIPLLLDGQKSSHRYDDAAGSFPVPIVDYLPFFVNLFQHMVKLGFEIFNRAQAVCTVRDRYWPLCIRSES